MAIPAACIGQFEKRGNRLIGFLKGKVFAQEGSQLLLDVGGVGYEVFATEGDQNRLAPGQEAFLYIFHHRKEDAEQLFGFLDPEGREIFALLNGVSGLGPKTALGILSHINGKALIQAIRGGDLGVLVQVPGVGNKTAQRLIFELQDKMEAFGEVAGEAEAAAVGKRGSGIYADAESALLFLGYSKKEIEDVLRRQMKGSPEADLNNLIRDALKELGKQ